MPMLYRYYKGLKRKLKTKRGAYKQYASETSKVRHLVIDFCIGDGCDIGFGGDKVKKENCMGIDYAYPYANTGSDKVDIACDVMNEPIPVADNTFDYVYSSHLIEDFKNTAKALKEFIRILKSGGNLILVFPDQPQYEIYCRNNNQTANKHHIHKTMGLKFMLDQMDALPGVRYELLFQSDCEVDYNVVLVLRVNKSVQ
jgi:ubiquinone/menaquinone biosynthesis C-methylase UbiE